jgi:divalent metal cation (Fe/Co/Zn/Cd) transporter
MASHLSSRTVIYAAIVGNLLVAATKFGAAAWTGSSAMLSEGIHSIVDLGLEFRGRPSRFRARRWLLPL